MARKGLAETIIALSSLARTGWMLRGVPHELAETVAEHSFAAAILSFELSVRLRENGAGIDPYKTAAIALLHDVGESVIGDIPKTAGIAEAKRYAENRALEYLALSDEAKKLVGEFDAQSTTEAVVAKISESLATLLRACHYKRMGYRVDEIIESMKAVIKHMLSLSRVSGYGGLVEEFVSEVLEPFHDIDC